MPNDTLSEINTLEEAQNAWELFLGRFFSPEPPDGVNIKFDPSLKHFSPRKNKEAKYQRPNKLEGRTDHSDDFDDFLNNSTVTIPADIVLTQEGLEQVENAIKKGLFADNSLKDASHTFYALWLFKQNKITRQQMSTLLARDQFPKEYPIQKTFPILNDKGEFSDIAIKLWLPVIKRNAYGAGLSDDHLNRLRLLIQAAPQSEQIFYLSSSNPHIMDESRQTLGNALYNSRSWYKTSYKGKTYDLHMSFGVTEALQIACNGINGAAASRAKLGNIDINAIKEGVEFYYRPVAINMSNTGVAVNTKGIHEYEHSPMPVVTAHDIFHARLHNTIRPEFHMMLNHMNQIIIKHTKEKWSKTLWELVDREFHTFQYHAPNLNSAQEGAQQFIALLHWKGRDKTFLFRDYEAGILSDAGFAIVWNMVNEPGVWKDLYKVDPDSLGEPYNKLIKQMHSFKKAIGNNPITAEMLSLKYCFFRGSSNEEFQRINTLLNSLEEPLKEKLQFGKYSQDTVKNLVILKFKYLNKAIPVEASSAKKILPLLIDLYLPSKYGAKNNILVLQKVKELTLTFKSSSLDNAFKKESLDNATAGLTLTETLDFLEECYEQIIVSTGYSHRNKIGDTLFSFFKNSLTTSQRNHINLLKEKLTEVINAQQNRPGLSNEDKEEFRWCMKNRGSNLALCNTTRFYLNTDSNSPSSKTSPK